jgi:hypothetical protein
MAGIADLTANSEPSASGRAGPARRATGAGASSATAAARGFAAQGRRARLVRNAWIAAATLPLLFTSFAWAARTGSGGTGAGAGSGHAQARVSLPLFVPPGIVLDSGDVSVSSGNSRLPLLGVLGPSAPTILFVVFDLTSSTTAALDMKPALQREIDALPYNYWVGLMNTSDGLRILQDPTQMRTVLDWQIEGVYPMGRPGLLDSLVEIERIATSVMARGGVRVAVLCITDSDVRNYPNNYQDQTVNGSDTHDVSRRFPGRDLQSKILHLKQQLMRDQAPLFVVHTVDREDALNREYRNGLQQFCESLGGGVWFARAFPEITPDLEAAFGRVRQFHLVTVTAPPSPRPLEIGMSIRHRHPPIASSDVDWRHMIVAR